MVETVGLLKLVWVRAIVIIREMVSPIWILVSPIWIEKCSFFPFPSRYHRNLYHQLSVSRNRFLSIFERLIVNVLYLSTVLTIRTLTCFHTSYIYEIICNKHDTALWYQPIGDTNFWNPKSLVSPGYHGDTSDTGATRTVIRHRWYQRSKTRRWYQFPEW